MTTKKFDPHSKEHQKALWQPIEYLSEYKLDILEKCGVSGRLLAYLRHPDKKSWKAVSRIMNILSLNDAEETVTEDIFLLILKNSLR